MSSSDHDDTISFDTRYSVTRPFRAVFRSLVLICSTIGWQEDERVWVTLPQCAPKPAAAGGPAFGDEAKLMQEVRCFLWHKDLGCSILPSLQQSWNSFYNRYSRLIHHSVVRSLPRSVSPSSIDDYVQDSWAAILQAIRLGGYDQTQSRVSSWLVGLVRRTTRNAAKRGSWWECRCCVRIAEVAPLLVSPQSIPDESATMTEMADDVLDKLAVLRRCISSKNYQIFRRRFLERQSIGEIAVALDLTYKAVESRCGRLKRHWDSLARIWVGDKDCEAAFCHGGLS